MSKLSNIKTPFGNEKRILAVLFGLGIILGFLLTPLGFETRMNEIRTLAFAAFFVTVGLLLPIVGLVLLFRKPNLAGVLAVSKIADCFGTWKMTNQEEEVFQAELAKGWHSSRANR